MRIGIVGIGGIGGPLGASLIRAGHDVELATKNDAMRAAIAANGLRVSGLLGDHVVRATAAPKLERRDYDVIVLATRLDGLEEACRSVAPLLVDRTVLLCLQNGVPEPRAAAIAGDDRVAGAVVGWSGTLEAPGHCVQTSTGRYVLGARGRIAAGRLDDLRDLLASHQPVRVTGNLAGARWGKLAINCAISTLGAASGLRLGELASHAFVRDLFLRILGEGAIAAQAEGVVMEKVVGIQPASLGITATPSFLGRAWRHAIVGAVALRHRRQRSGMLQRLEQGRPTGQVDDLNGTIVAVCKQHGLAAPVNAKLLEMVHEIEAGQRKIAFENLVELRRAV